MIKNVGKKDKGIRFGAGILLVGLSLIPGIGTGLRVVVLAAAAVAIVTAYTGF